MAKQRARKRASAPSQARGAAHRPLWPFVVAIAVLVLVAFAVSRTLGGGTAPNQANVLAAAPDLSAKATIDSIPCESTERVTYHVHAHLAVFVDAQPRVIPAGIGIAAPRQVQNTANGPFVAAGACFYWLHTHTSDGVIHIESSEPMPFTLGQFFDIWQQPLTAGHVGPAQGTITAYVNGERYTGALREIPLAAHALIQLDVDQDVPPQAFAFPAGL